MAQTILFKKVPIFNDQVRSELDYLASSLQIVTLHAGEALFAKLKKGKVCSSSWMDKWRSCWASCST